MGATGVMTDFPTKLSDFLKAHPDFVTNKFDKHLIRDVIRQCVWLIITVCDMVNKKSLSPSELNTEIGTPRTNCTVKFDSNAH